MSIRSACDEPWSTHWCLQTLHTKKKSYHKGVSAFCLRLRLALLLGNGWCEVARSDSDYIGTHYCC